jgi:hypothetical protein
MMQYKYEVPELLPAGHTYRVRLNKDHISELRDSGLGYLKIANTMNAEQRATKWGGAWQSASVRAVLRSSQKLALADFMS